MCKWSSPKWSSKDRRCYEPSCKTAGRGVYLLSAVRFVWNLFFAVFLLIADLLQHCSGGSCSHALFLFTKTGQLLKKLFGILRQTAIVIKNIIRGDVQQANHHKQIFKTGVSPAILYFQNRSWLNPDLFCKIVLCDPLALAGYANDLALVNLRFLHYNSPRHNLIMQYDKYECINSAYKDVLYFTNGRRLCMIPS